MAAVVNGKWFETAMLVIDMQNDFILPGGPMHVAGGQAIVPTVIRAVSVARKRGISVIWVVREHDPFGRDVEVFRRHLYVNGKGPIVKGTKGAELVEGLILVEGEYKLVKTRFSAFFDTNLNSLLQSFGIKSLVVVGVQTPNCIRQTTFDAVASNFHPVTVIVDATAAATPEVHAANILDMQNIGVLTPTLSECMYEEKPPQGFIQTGTCYSFSYRYITCLFFMVKLTKMNSINIF
ncbi:hypothetical protein HPP92_003537 [Vanilla planifolia]|uniref:Isochorismatase-like domain-containing protein n=1 Tax=Vanilla planifolia TaxID=51239 RepID=A0A835RVT7_VANPL|nr:hypothetical protein HPP92_003927 [Vanilla planifolia]KAG0503465.1 hypothetical protein HPP92_003537 [Vanilla planifolia]